ncbi:Peptidyl-prolyl cis-trans isomerase D, partial [Bienertia sinuspersici]
SSAGSPIFLLPASRPSWPPTRRAWPVFVVELPGSVADLTSFGLPQSTPVGNFTSGLRHLPASWFYCFCGVKASLNLSLFMFMESLEICRTFQEDLKGILFDGSNLESEDAELYDYISSLKNPKDILVHSSNLKEEGNSSFKGGDLDGALEKYSLSMVFLSCLDLNETGVRSSFSQLATSVVLNMAASFLKKKEFRNVGHFCSTVLNHNPDNVKALFRRANAAMGLGNYEFASWDLKVAHEVEPSNQEVTRKLREVEQILNSLPEQNHGQGKKEGEMSLGFSNHIKDLRIEERESIRNEEETSEGNEIEQCEMMDVETYNKSNSVKEVGSAKGRPKEKEVALSEGGNDKEMLDVGSGNATKVGGSAPKVTKSKYHFQNRRKPGSALVISKDDYLLLAKGKTIQHFNLRSGTTMSIKAISTPHKLPGKSSKNRTQHFPSSPPIQQDENMDPKVSIDNVSHGEPCQSEDNSVMEISPPCPEEVKKRQPAEANETLPSSHINPFDESPTCVQAVVASSCTILEGLLSMMIIIQHVSQAIVAA